MDGAYKVKVISTSEMTKALVDEKTPLQPNNHLHLQLGNAPSKQPPSPPYVINRFLDNATLAIVIADTSTDSAGFDKLLHELSESSAIPVAIVISPLKFSNHIGNSLIRRTLNDYGIPYVFFKSSRYFKGESDPTQHTIPPELSTQIFGLISCLSKITTTEGITSIDLGQIYQFFRLPGHFTCGTATAEDVNRYKSAVNRAISNSVLAGQSLSDAASIFVCIQANRSIKLSDINKIISTISEQASDVADIAFSLVYNEEIGNKIEITILGGGFTYPRKTGTHPPPTELEKLQNEAKSSSILISTLREQLANTNSNTAEKNKELEKHLEEETNRRKQIESTIDELTKKVSTLKAQRTNESIAAIKNSLETSDSNITSLSAWSWRLKYLAIFSFSCAIIPTTLTSYFLLFPESSYHSQAITTIKEMGNMALIAISTPFIAFLTIGTTLLRHDSKLITEIRFYTEHKLQIDRLAGVLGFAQQAAISDVKANDFIEETYTLVRNRLIDISTSETGSKDSKAPDSSEKTDTPAWIHDVINQLKK